MNEAEWLASSDPARMLEYLTDRPRDGTVRGGVTAPPLISKRKQRLFVAAGLRIVLPETSAKVEAMADDPSIPPDPAWWPTDKDADDACRCVVTASGRWSATQGVLADLLREIVGNPFRPVTLPSGEGKCPQCRGCGRTIRRGAGASVVRQEPPCDACRGTGRTPCPWLTPTVLSLAQAAYDHRDPATGHLAADRLAILADALEEAGCVDDGILFHLRGEFGCDECRGVGFIYGPPYSLNRLTCPKCVGQGTLPHPPHVRGCWAIDLILGKE